MSVSGPVGAALADAIKALGKVEARDGAVVALARGYAEQIDSTPAALVKLGPLLLASLVELGMTPRARAAVVGKDKERGAEEPKSVLDEMRDEYDAVARPSD